MAANAQSPSRDGGLPASFLATVSGNKSLFLVVILLAIFVCTGFSALSALMVLGEVLIEDFPEEDGFRGRLLLKGILFALCTLASACGVVILKRPQALEPLSPLESSRGAHAFFLGVCAFAALVLLPHLQTFPWAAPDEYHHLVVAKNLQQHGAYASGHPQSGFKYFDDYDSVGPPLIVAMATVFSVTGVSVGPGRALVGCSFLVLCLAAYALCLPVFGARSSALSILMMFMALNTIYLARTVYGEVPAFLFFISGLVLWSRSLDGRSVVGSAAGAGVLFGLAVMTKTFIAISAWAFLAAWLYDRSTFRKIGWKQVVYPALGVVVVFVPWWLLKGRSADLIQEHLSTILYYRHSLMFGFDSMLKGFAWLAKNSFVILAAGLSVAWVIPTVFRTRYSPAFVVLILMAIEFVFWWIFFTPGHIPRYLWYSFAIFALLSGPLVERCVKGIRTASVTSRACCVLVLLICVGPGIGRTIEKTAKVYGPSEMESDTALAEYVSALPHDARLATTYWPLEKSLNFLADRYVPYVDGDDPSIGGFDTVFWDSQARPIPPQILKVDRRVGRYIVVTKEDK